MADGFLKSVQALYDAVASGKRQESKVAMADVLRLWPECWTALKAGKPVVAKSAPAASTAAAAGSVLPPKLGH